MSELTLVKHDSAPYGTRHKGFVESGTRQIGVTLREPSDRDWSGITYVLVNGWTAQKNSMRPAALEAVDAGHKAITFNFTNRRLGNALLSNATDCAAVIDALPQDTRRAAIALSMGGPVLIRALMQTQAKLEAATLVASAQCITEELSPVNIAKHLVAEGRELAGLYRHPLNAVHLGAGVMRNFAERPLAVVGEFGELISGTVHEDFQRVKTGAEAPYMRFMYGLGDHLLPADAQLGGVCDMLFDEVVPYRGGHVELAKDQMLARTIFALDAVQMSPSFIPEFSMAA